MVTIVSVAVSAGAYGGQVAATPALTALDRAKVEYTVRHYDHDPAASDAGGYGLEAAAALELAPSRVFKTLLVQVDSGLVVAVCPSSGRLDLKAVAQAVGGKRASMADPAVAERVTGYVVGGISPFGQKKRLPTVVDRSVAEHPTVFVSGGRRGLNLEVAPAVLIGVTSARLADISAGAR